MNPFDAILAQPAAIAFLQRALAADRLPHGLLFAGPTGVGKATAAAALAAVFLGKEGTPLDPSTLPNHPDYHVVTRDLIRYHDKTGKSKGIALALDVIRAELIAPAGRKSALGRGKVFVVDEAETMNASAQNALLKTLEEPHGRTLILLLTDQPGALLPTVRSRCQVVRFAPLPEPVVRSELESRGIDPKTANTAAKLADGSLGVALRWIEDGVVSAALELKSLLDDALAPSPGRAVERRVDLPEWFKCAAENYAEKQLKRDPLSSKDAATREGLTVYLRLTAARFRRELRDPAATPACLERSAARIDAVSRAASYLDANVNVPLVFQQLAGALGRH